MDTEQTIQFYCGDIKERLKACRSKSIALILKHQLCSELKIHCSSQMVQNILTHHIDELIRDIFTEDSTNRYLEEK